MAFDLMRWNTRVATFGHILPRNPSDAKAKTKLQQQEAQIQNQSCTRISLLPKGSTTPRQQCKTYSWRGVATIRAWVSGARYNVEIQARAACLILTLTLFKFSHGSFTNVRAIKITQP